MEYRNTGAPFTRDDGTRWEPDMVAEPTANELARRAYKLRPVIEVVEPSPSPPVMESSDVAGEEGQSPWPLRMSPERYLTLHPEGPHAGQANEILTQQRLDEEERTDGDSDE